MNRAYLLLMLLLLTLVLTTLALPALGADDEGWVSLFNGKDMTGWRINENSKAFRVEDGMIIVQGPSRPRLLRRRGRQGELPQFPC